jgi:tRNA modification GTPase
MNNNSLIEDTIVALATPLGESAIAIVRVSGNLSKDIFRSVTKKRDINKLNGKFLLSKYFSIHNKIIDNCIFLFFSENNSYTGEPSFEINCHGNPLIINKIIKDLIKRDKNCRLAKPGEFTKRAFKNKKIDLIQAEGIHNLIKSKNEISLKAGRQQLSGFLTNRIKKIEDIIFSVIVKIEAIINFPDQTLDLSIKKLKVKIYKIINIINNLVLGRKMFHRYLLNKPFKVIIIGHPNAGKSSLFNSLVKNKEYNSIVSSIKGTTRDCCISKITSLKNFFIRFIDSAGISLNTNSKVEALAMEKTIDLIQNSDFYFLVIDSSKSFSTNFLEIIKNKLNVNNTIIVMNKMDIKSRNFILPNFYSNFQKVFISTKLQIGIQELLQILQSLLKKSEKQAFKNIKSPIIEKRHQKFLLKTKSILKKVIKETSLEVPNEILILEKLYLGLKIIKKISRSSDKSILKEIFSNFCIGK